METEAVVYDYATGQRVGLASEALEKASLSAAGREGAVRAFGLVGGEWQLDRYSELRCARTVFVVREVKP